MQILIDDQKGILLINRGGKAFDVDVADDAKILISCFNSATGSHKATVLGLPIDAYISSSANDDHLIRTWALRIRYPSSASGIMNCTP